MSLLYDLPRPETIRKYTVSILAPCPVTEKFRLRNLEAGKTVNGNVRKKFEFRNRRVLKK